MSDFPAQFQWIPLDISMSPFPRFKRTDTVPSDGKCAVGPGEKAIPSSTHFVAMKPWWM